MQALYLLKSGQAHTRQAVAALLGVHRETVGDWLHCYAQQGLAGLLLRRLPPGATPTLTAQQQARLQTRLQQPAGFGSYREIQDWLVSEFAVSMPYTTVFSLVHDRLRARPTVARPQAEKKTRRRRRNLSPSLLSKSRPSASKHARPPVPCVCGRATKAVLG